MNECNEADWAMAFALVGVCMSFAALVWAMAWGEKK